jgi:cysteine-rich repeat protein
VCTHTPVCGDGKIEGSETCDDGNTKSGDGCSATCTVEPGYACTGSPSVCTTTCGDGIKAGTEQCDDGNTSNEDGCDSTCHIEPGWTCTGSPSVCKPIPPTSVCGNGIKEPGEECDDGNTKNGDGCSSTCQEEPGFVCEGENPSVCTPVSPPPVCGDGIVDTATGEQCDNTSECCQHCLVIPANTPCNGNSGDRCDGKGSCKPASDVNPDQNPPPGVCIGKLNPNCIPGDSCSLSLGNPSVSSIWALGSGLLVLGLGRLRIRKKKGRFEKVD